MSTLSSFDTIPLLDFHELITEKQRFLTRLREAIVDVGFLYVKNTGFPDRLVEDLKGLLPALFDIAESEKLQIELENSPHFVGYSAVGSETTAGASDQREQFEFVSPQDVRWKPGLPLYLRLAGPNQYPSSLPRAQEVIDAYMQSMTDFASRLKIVRYPEAKQEGMSQGVGLHKDSSGWWTFLLQASSPEVRGLQVLNKTGNWIDVPSIPGSFVVNIGQAFEVITHGACKATTHRVLGGLKERFSVPFFLGVRGDLTKQEALRSFAHHFPQRSSESMEAASVDSAFLRGKYDTWGESELCTKIRSHRKAGRQFYSEVYERYVQDS